MNRPRSNTASYTLAQRLLRISMCPIEPMMSSEEETHPFAQGNVGAEATVFYKPDTGASPEGDLVRVREKPGLRTCPSPASSYSWGWSPPLTSPLRKLELN